MGRKKNATKTEIKIITTRLIEISMKVDDYVYKHIPISKWEAEKYMREVSAYQVQCGRDQRSLQVIDKLTRCMKAIIRDHQENRNDANHDSFREARDNRSTSTSPVYSIPDEDRNHLTQIAEETNEGNVDIITYIDLTNVEDEDNNVNDTNTKMATEYNVEVEIHRSISNLSLKDVEHTPKEGIEDANCSQSILNNFESIENMQQNKTNDVTPKSTVPLRVVNFCDINKTNKVFQTSNISKDNTETFFQPLTKLNTITGTVPKIPITIRKTKDNLITSVAGETKSGKVIQPNVSIPKNDNLTSYKYSTPNIFESQRRTCKDIDRPCTMNTSNQDADITQTSKNKVSKTTETFAPNFIMPTNSHHEVTKSRHILNNDKSSKAVSNKKTKANSKDIAHSARSVAIKKKKTTRKKTANSIDKKKTILKIKNKKRSIVPDLDKNKKVPIYNENVIDDLSWIENIRYVREMAVGENDHKLQLEDDFWDNYYLPANWHDNEFA